MTSMRHQEEKKKRLKAVEIDKIRYPKHLNLMQTQIGWDNLSRGKLAREWRIYQNEYEAAKTRERKDCNIKMRIEYGIVSNPYEKDKEKKQKRKRSQKMCSTFH